MKPRGETKGRTGEERASKAGEGQGGTGTEPGSRGGAKNELERKMRGENRDEVALYKPCFLPKIGQLEDLGMQAAVPQVPGTRDAGNMTRPQLGHCPLPLAQQGSAPHVNQCPAAIRLHYARLAK